MVLAEHGVPSKVLHEATMSSDIKEWEESLRQEQRSLEQLLQEATDNGSDSFEVCDTDLSKFTDFMNADHFEHTVMIDCTASDSVCDMYPKWLASGLHVISPNKLAGSGPLARFQSCLQTLGDSSATWAYQATVGAQMPAISVIRDILQTGDQVKKVLGVFSGSMSFVLNTLSEHPDMRFSQALALAAEKGFTEPDPLLDVNGEDTARKALIVARELGLNLELTDVAVQSVVPLSSLDDLGDADKALAAKLAVATEAGERLRYVGEIDVSAGTVSVHLKSFPLDSPSIAAGNDTMIAFTTARFPDETPLVLRGPGSGPVATAAGVFADIIRLSRTLAP